MFAEVRPYCGCLIARDGKVVAESTARVDDCFAGFLWGSDGCTWNDLRCSHGGYIWTLFEEMSERFKNRGKGPFTSRETWTECSAGIRRIQIPSITVVIITALISKISNSVIATTVNNRDAHQAKFHVPIHKESAASFSDLWHGIDLLAALPIHISSRIYSFRATVRDTDHSCWGKTAAFLGAFVATAIWIGVRWVTFTLAPLLTQSRIENLQPCSITACI